MKHKLAHELEIKIEIKPVGLIKEKKWNPQS